MKLRALFSLLFVPLALGMASPAGAADVPGRVTLRAWSGFTTLSLGHVNDNIREMRDAFRADTLVEDSIWDPFGGAGNLRAEMEVQLTPIFSAGLGFSSQRGSVRLEATRVFSYELDGEPAEIEIFEEEPIVKAWDIVGTLGVRVPSAPGLGFGMQLGFVRGTYEVQQSHLIDTFTELPSMEIANGLWKGTGVVLGAYTGYERAVTRELNVCTRMGYRYRRIGRLDGMLQTTIWGDQGNAREWEQGPLLDRNGQVMELDMSGFYFDIGLSLGFGGQAR